MVTEQQAKSSPWDVFINLLAVIALYAAMWSVLSLLFSFIDLRLPDPADRPLDLRDSIRSALAVLIIFFPAYVWAWRSIEVDLAANREKRRRWLRTCPIYLTLFVAGVFALGDLSYVVYYFLTGDLTARVILKVAAIGLVAGTVFGFHLYVLGREPGGFALGARVFGYLTCVLVAMVAIAGFEVAGSPTRARLQRLDARRIENLAAIQTKLVSYWQQKRTLPGSIDDLNDDLVGFTAPTDPETHHPYEYRATGSTSFDLCADFALKDYEVRRTVYVWVPESDGGYNSAWNHDVGHVCFTRTIDPSRNPPCAGAATTNSRSRRITRESPKIHCLWVSEGIESVGNRADNG